MLPLPPLPPAPRYEIRPPTPGEIEPARQFLSALGWAHRLGDPARFAALLAQSQRVEVAITPDGEIVGFARAITDGLSNGYLSMVAVAPVHRHQGLGRRLVQAVMGDEPGITWVLRAGRDEAAGFFARLGFESSSQAMERRRR
ncbi:MAG TPA: GNAT family N-acetyltransferase [Ideonella sp.]|uniref:GNAT family N-acetyltransferase n=1 Tax=Ideonella sp. TaxID=1929293 RepID=UPI002C8FE21B|nr:GNAT family N-acetyltransferase [Ideonella sp.]HSI52136.1 GNAT family N-acetyltransferase [Ideonella sp.]